MMGLLSNRAARGTIAVLALLVLGVWADKELFKLPASLSSVHGIEKALQVSCKTTQLGVADIVLRRRHLYKL